MLRNLESQHFALVVKSHTPRDDEPHVGARITNRQNLFPVTVLEEMERQFLDQSRDFLGAHSLEKR